MTRHHRLLMQVAVLTAAGMLVASCGDGAPDEATSIDDIAAPSATGADGSDGGGNVLEELRASGTLRVANTQANPPYSFIDGSNELVGYDVDIAKEVASRMGIDNVDFVVGTFQTFIPGLNSDKWDAVVSGLSVTEERKAQVEFSCPYQVNDVSIFVAPDTEGINVEEDLVGKEVAVSEGTTQEDQANEIEGTTVLTYSNSTLALRDVATGRADAYIGAKFTGAYLAEQNNLDVRPTDGYLTREINAMAFPKGQEEVAEAANEALAAMIDDGTLTEISEQWLGGLDMAEGLNELPPC